MIERGRYDELGVLMITVALMTLILPIITVVLLNPAKTGNPGSISKKLRYQSRIVKTRAHGARP
jgi:hypothetical protein